MKQLTERILAVLMGTSAGLIAVFIPFALVQPDRSFALMPDWVHRVAIPLESSLQEGACAGQPGALNVSFDDVQDRLAPLMKLEISGDRTTVRAAFSSHWAESRVVVLGIRAQSVTVLAQFETDYGEFPGWVSAAGSSVHVHADRACIDLRVRRMDGSSTQERWTASIPLL